MRLANQSVWHRNVRLIVLLSVRIQIWEKCWNMLATSSNARNQYVRYNALKQDVGAMLAQDARQFVTSQSVSWHV
jgi:hypothetical protein